MIAIVLPADDEVEYVQCCVHFDRFAKRTRAEVERRLCTKRGLRGVARRKQRQLKLSKRSLRCTYPRVSDFVAIVG